MTAFDWAVVAVIGGSILLAALRGFVRSAVSLGAWVAALVLALQLGPALAGHLAGLSLPSLASQALGFALVFLGVVVAGALVGIVLARALRAVGLGAVDRLFGALFGLGRGLLVVLAGVLLAGFTAIPRHDWWQNSVLAAHFTEAVLAVRPYLPAEWAARLDYSAPGSPGAPPGRAFEPRGSRSLSDLG
jgi:membrane protein required for colicin V production